MDISTIITGGIAIGGLLGFAYGYFRKGLADSTIDLLQKQNDVLRDSLTDRDKTIAAYEAELKTLRETNKTLVSLAQQTPEVRKLTAKITDLAISISEVMKHIGVKKK